MQIPLLNVIVVLIVIGFAWWIFSAYVLPKIAEPFHTAIIVILALACIVWLLSLIGVVGPLRFT